MKLIFLPGIFNFSLLSLLVVLCTGCLSLPESACPYRIFIQEDELSGENASFSFTITNLSDKEIKEFTLVLNLIDEEGASAFISGQASFPFSKNIPSWEDFSTILNFECFLASEDTFFEKDYIYIERIVYEDGSVWEDFLGRYAR